MHLERGRGEETASQSRTSWSPSRAVRTPRSAPAARTDVTEELAVETSPRGLDVVQDPMLREAKVQNLETRVCCGKCDHESRGSHMVPLSSEREKRRLAWTTPWSDRSLTSRSSVNGGGTPLISPENSMCGPMTLVFTRGQNSGLINRVANERARSGIPRFHANNEVSLLVKVVSSGLNPSHLSD